MDTIIFDSPFDRNTFIRQNRVFWNYSWKENRKSMKKLLLISVILLSFGILVRLDGNINNPITFIGILFLCISLLIGLLMLSSWKKYNKIIKEVADEYEKMNSELILEITEDSLRYKDFQKQLELKWSVFKHYTLYKGLIILVPKYFISGAFLFDTKDDTEVDKCKQVLKILKDKLKYVES